MGSFNSRKRRLQAVVFFFLLFLCAFDSERSIIILPLAAEPVPAPVSVLLAHVGPQSIHAVAVAYRIGIGSAYGSDLSQATALVALINDIIEAEVGRMAGVSPSADELRAFAAGAKKNSKAPAVLAAIRRVFGSDTNSYHRLFLAPTIINRKLRAWFSRNAAMHRQQRDVMHKAWALVHSGMGFEQTAEAAGLNYSKQAYGKQKKASPDALKVFFPQGVASMSEGFKKLLDETEEGEIVTTIAEDDHGYRIVRLIDKKAGSYNTEEISLAKAAFDQWFEEQAGKIDIGIDDTELKREIVATYGNILWVKRLQQN